MPESMREVGVHTVFTFSIGKILGKSYTKSGMILYRNIKDVTFQRWMATVPFSEPPRYLS